jgi:hypothetical protein
MALQTNLAMVQDAEGRRPHRLRLTCATLLTAAVVGSLGGWRLHEQGDVRSTEPPSVAVAATLEVEQPLVREAPSVPSAHHLYLVASEEEAARLWNMLSEAIAHRFQLGDRSQTVSVLVTEGLDSEVIAALSSMPPDQQLVDLQLVDLRR